MLGINPEAEFMNIEVSVHNLETSQTYNAYITNQFQTTVAQRGRGRVKFLSMR
jgi:hypothetical protein